MRINDKEKYMSIKDSISMNNLKKIINAKDYSIVKVAMSSNISESTVKAYMNGQKIPSLPTLISVADFLNCNIDYLLDRTNNPIKISDLEKISKDPDLNQLIQSVISLPKDKQKIVGAFIKGLLRD